MERIIKSENDKKKEFLRSYQKARKTLGRLEEQLAELRLSKITPSAINYDGMPHASGITDLSDYAAKMNEIEQNIFNARYEQLCAFQRVQQRIEAMEDEQEKNLLTYRYLQGLKWEAVCVKMGHSWQHVHRIHAKALNNFIM